MWSTLAGSLISLAVVCQAAALDCACDAFANGAHPRNRRLCQKKEAGKDVCRPRDDSGNCPSDQDECKGRSHNSLPVCDGCTFRNGGRPYDEYNCFAGQEGDTTWCVPTHAVGVCEACVSCDTSSCDSGSSAGCRQEKLWDCCMEEEGCSDRAGEYKDCFEGCCRAAEIDEWSCWDKYHRCDTSGCSTKACRREARQECCAAEKECGDDDRSCHFDCCETVEIGRGDCWDRYYSCDTSDCGTKSCRKETRLGCCAAGCDDDASVEEKKSCYFDCCDDVELGNGCQELFDEYSGCDTSECDALAAGVAFCKKQKRQECCLDGNSCSSLSGDDEQACYFSCCEVAGIDQDKCEEMHYELTSP